MAEQTSRLKDLMTQKQLPTMLRGHLRRSWRYHISLGSVLWAICGRRVDSASFFSVYLKDEILEVAGKIYKAGMSLLVIDTENKFVSTGFAKEIARVAQGFLYRLLKFLSASILSNRDRLILTFSGKYYYLPNASDAVISSTTREALSSLKNSWNHVIVFLLLPPLSVWKELKGS